MHSLTMAMETGTGTDMVMDMVTGMVTVMSMDTMTITRAMMERQPCHHWYSTLRR